VEDGRTTVPLTFQPKESMFIVFTNQKNAHTGSGYAENFPETDVLYTLDGEWTVDFLNKDIAPEEKQEWKELKDWTTCQNEQIKYYSGTARYRTTFEAGDLPQDRDVVIDLGNVGVMARVKLNGVDLGGVWIDPFVLPVNGNLKAGENVLEVETVNTWRNKLVQEDDMPQEERYTWLNVDDVESGEELMPSGLLGPVTIQVIASEKQ